MRRIMRERRGARRQASGRIAATLLASPLPLVSVSVPVVSACAAPALALATEPAPVKTSVSPLIPVLIVPLLPNAPAATVMVES